MHVNRLSADNDEVNIEDDDNFYQVCNICFYYWVQSILALNFLQKWEQEWGPLLAPSHFKVGWHLKIIGKRGPLQAPSYFKTGQNNRPRNGICRKFRAVTIFLIMFHWYIFNPLVIITEACQYWAFTNSKQNIHQIHLQVFTTEEL